MCAEIWRRDFWRKSFAGPLSTPADWRRQRRLLPPACLPRMTAWRRPHVHAQDESADKRKRDGAGRDGWTAEVGSKLCRAILK